ncbi:CPBP family intramembrane metalloprotease [Streptomyces albiaxialis]|uniref:CPBP family intramembrane metalloprotease n=1 Tax=Streptomyces albiaxialis TaxID=329523 RepID=A0ABN2W655_9ACTN
MATANARSGGLVLFMTVSFATSWAAWFLAMNLDGSATEPPAIGPYVFGAFGPLIGALVVRIRRRRRGEPLPEHVVRFRPATLLWAPFLLALAAASVVGAAFLAHALGGPGVDLSEADGLFEKAGGAAPFFVSMLVTGPLSEEAGWRGTAYPRMRASMGRFTVGLVLGAIWLVWHLPLFFIDGTVQNKLGIDTLSGALFAASVLPMAMLTGYAYERAGVAASIAVHFAANTTMVLLGVEEPVTQASIMGVQLLLVLALLALPGTRRKPAAPSADPSSHPLAHTGA